MKQAAYAIVLTIATALSFQLIADKKAKTTKKKQVIAIVNKMVNQKKTWVSSHNTIAKNQPTELVLVNTLDAPHGFEIKKVLKPIVLLPHETKKITLAPMAKSQNLVISCHMLSLIHI